MFAKLIYEKPHTFGVFSRDCVQVCLEVPSMGSLLLTDQLVYDLPDTGQVIVKAPSLAIDHKGKSWLYQFINTVTQAGHLISL